MATTGRLAIAAGGRAAWLAVEAWIPRTLSLVGATATLAPTGADATCRTFTATAARATGCAPVKAACGTAVTPPGTVLLTYVMLVLLYPLCRWYRTVKRAHPDSFLKYI